MTAPTTPMPLDDYDAIASAVMETERGRWFLAEYARRNRAADTASVLGALAEIERKLTAGQGGGREAEDFTEIMRRVAVRAALVREELHDLGHDARVTAALTHLDRLERLVSGLAAPTSSAEAVVAVEREDARDAPTLALPAPQAAVETPPIELEDEIPTIETYAIAHEDETTAQDEAAFLEDAEELDDEERKPAEAFAPPVVTVEAVAIERAPRGAQPVARAPKLLDTLSESDKALLFA